jgi:hypothetical protein
MKNEIRFTTKRGETIYATRYNNKTVLISDGKIYYWNPTGNGYPGCIQHGGNMLSGTEFRKSSQGGGSWDAIIIATGTINHITTTSLYLINNIPTLQEVNEMLEKGTLKSMFGDRWPVETPNPTAGKNNEWVRI